MNLNTKSYNKNDMPYLAQLKFIFNEIESQSQFSVEF